MEWVFYYKDYSFAFSLPVLVNFIFRDSLLSYQISIALVIFFLSLGFQKIVFHFDRSWKSWLLILISHVLWWSHWTFYDLHLQFFKTAIAITFFIWSLFFLLRGAWIAAFLLMMLAIASHKLMVLVTGIFVLIYFFTQSKKLQISTRKITMFGLLGLTLIGLALWIHPRLYLHVLHLFTDMKRHKLLSFLRWGNDPRFYLIYVSVLSVLGLSFLFLREKRNNSFEATWLFFSFCVLLCLPFLLPDPLNSDSLSYRLFLFSIVFFPLLFCWFLKEHRFLILGSLGFLLVFSFYEWSQRRPLDTWVNPWPVRLPQAEKINELVPVGSLIYAPHGIQFYLAYVTNFRPRSFLIDKNLEETYRVAYVKPYLKQEESLLANDLRQLSLRIFNDEFALLKESDWIWLSEHYMFIPLPMNMLKPKPAFVQDY